MNPTQIYGKAFAHPFQDVGGRTKTAGEYQDVEKENQVRDLDTICQKSRHDLEKGTRMLIMICEMDIHEF